MRSLFFLALLVACAASAQPNSAQPNLEQTVYDTVKCDKVTIHEDGFVTFRAPLVVGDVSVTGKNRRTVVNGVQIDAVAIKKCKTV